MLSLDPDLPRRLRRGDDEARRELALGAGPSLLALARRLLGDDDAARDARQEALVRALERLDQLENDRSFAPWLVRLTVNVCRDHARREGKLADTHARVAVNGSHHSPDDPAASAVTSDERERVARAVAALPHLEREAVVLRHYHDLTFAEIAHAQDAPLSTVQSRLERGLRRLAVALSERAHHDERQTNRI